MQIQNYPYRYPPSMQSYVSSPNYPYPMNFTQAPSFDHQVLVNYDGRPMLQGLNINSGPFMFPLRQPQIAYPLTHSIPDPYQQSFINAYGRNNYIPAQIVYRGYG